MTAEEMKAMMQVWKCDGCGTVYAEYVNGCPRCYSHGLFFSVHLADLPAAKPTGEGE